MKSIRNLDNNKQHEKVASNNYSAHKDEVYWTESDLLLLQQNIVLLLKWS